MPCDPLLARFGDSFCLVLGIDFMVVRKHPAVMAALGFQSATIVDSLNLVPRPLSSPQRSGTA